MSLSDRKKEECLDVKETVRLLSECPIKYEEKENEFELYILYKEKWRCVGTCDGSEEVHCGHFYHKNKEGIIGICTRLNPKNWLEPTEYLIEECVGWGEGSYVYDKYIFIIDADTDG